VLTGLHHVQVSCPAGSEDALRTESRAKIDQWNELGRTLCGAFLEAAARVPV
jgi:hypothetical protein